MFARPDSDVSEGHCGEPSQQVSTLRWHRSHHTPLCLQTSCASHAGQSPMADTLPPLSDGFDSPGHQGGLNTAGAGGRRVERCRSPSFALEGAAYSQLASRGSAVNADPFLPGVRRRDLQRDREGRFGRAAEGGERPVGWGGWRKPARLGVPASDGALARGRSTAPPGRVANVADHVGECVAAAEAMFALVPLGSPCVASGQVRSRPGPLDPSQVRPECTDAVLGEHSVGRPQFRESADDRSTLVASEIPGRPVTRAECDANTVGEVDRDDAIRRGAESAAVGRWRTHEQNPARHPETPLHPSATTTRTNGCKRYASGSHRTSNGSFNKCAPALARSGRSGRLPRTSDVDRGSDLHQLLVGNAHELGRVHRVAAHEREQPLSPQRHAGRLRGIERRARQEI